MSHILLQIRRLPEDLPTVSCHEKSHVFHNVAHIPDAPLLSVQPALSHGNLPVRLSDIPVENTR